MTLDPQPATPRWNWLRVAEVGAPLLAFLAILAYYGGRRYYDAYYAVFHVSPSDLGMSREDVMFHSWYYVPIFAFGIIGTLTGISAALSRQRRNLGQPPAIIPPRPDASWLARLAWKYEIAPEPYTSWVVYGFVFAISTFILSSIANGVQNGLLVTIQGMVSFESTQIGFFLATLAVLHGITLLRAAGLLAAILVYLLIVPPLSGTVEGRADEDQGDPGRKAIVWMREDPQLSWTKVADIFRSPEVRVLGTNDRFTVIWSKPTGTVLLPTADVLRIDRP